MYEIRRWASGGWKLQYPMFFPIGRGLALRPDGRAIAVIELISHPQSPGIVRLVNVDDGSTSKLWAAGHRVEDVAWAAEGALLAARFDGVLVALRQDEEEPRKVTRHTGQALAVAADPQRKIAAVGWQSGMLRLVDIAANRPLTERSGMHPHGVTSLAFAPNGQLTSGGEDGEIIIWGDDLSEKRILSGHEDAVLSLAWSADGSLLASGSRDGTVVVWDGLPASAQRRPAPRKPLPSEVAPAAPVETPLVPGDLWERFARTAGPIEPGWYRVVVLEHDLTTSHHDFPRLKEAQRHANDAASETDPVEPLAFIFDSGLQFVGRGRHYASGASASSRPSRSSAVFTPASADTASTGEYFVVYDRDSGTYPEAYRLLAKGERIRDFDDADGWSGYVPANRANVLLDALRATYAGEQFEVSIKRAKRWGEARRAARARGRGRSTFASYIFATPDERTFPERYRILKADEKILDSNELNMMTGVVSERVADAFHDALTASYRGTDMTVGRASGTSWSGLEANYYGLGLDSDHFFD